MGQRSSQFTEQELQDYEDLTYFTKKEVLTAHQKFKALAPEKVGHNKNAKLPMSKMFQYPELSVNPFRDRICKIFSSSQDGDCTFEDFLDMMSVFSEKAPRSVKAEHAFRIYDFDGDDMLGVNDLRQVIDRLTGSEQSLSEENMQHLIENVLDEADLDDDGALSFAEFEHVVSKSPDFTSRGGFLLEMPLRSNLNIGCSFACKLLQVGDVGVDEIEALQKSVVLDLGDIDLMHLSDLLTSRNDAPFRL